MGVGVSVGIKRRVNCSVKVGKKVTRLTSLPWKRGVLGSGLGRVAGEDLEKMRVSSVESVLECGGPRGEVRFAGEGGDEL